VRPIETLLILYSFALLLRGVLAPNRGGGSTVFFCVGLLLVLSAHVFFEGWRRPMLPTYLAVLLLCLSATFPLTRTGSATGLIPISVAFLLLIGVATALILPAIRLPSLQGPYRVAMTELLLPAPAVSGMPDRNALEHPPPHVRIWYPTTAQAPGPFDASFLRTRWHQLGTAAQPVYAVADAPLISGAETLPILVYFPGWPGTQVENHALVRELVSQGYVVLSIEYPARVPGMSDAYYQALVKELERPLYYGSEAMYKALVRVAEVRAHTRATDASRALDAMTVLSAEEPSNRFYHRLDWQRLGVVGFSLGGAVAAQAVYQDPRYKAAINIDGRHWAETREAGVARPYMMLSEVLNMPTAADRASPNLDWRYNAVEDTDDYTQLYRNLARHGGIHVTVNGTAHMSFTDKSLRSPWKRLTEGGPIDGRRALRITSDYVLAFFGKYLNGVDSPLLKDGSPPNYPEVDVRIYPAPPSADPE
jgi:dienelactone hydrolase